MLVIRQYGPKEPDASIELGDLVKLARDNNSLERTPKQDQDFDWNR